MGGAGLRATVCGLALAPRTLNPSAAMAERSPSADKCRRPSPSVKPPACGGPRGGAVAQRRPDPTPPPPLTQPLAPRRVLWQPGVGGDEDDQTPGHHQRWQAIQELPVRAHPRNSGGLHEPRRGTASRDSARRPHTHCGSGRRQSRLAACTTEKGPPNAAVGGRAQASPCMKVTRAGTAVSGRRATPRSVISPSTAYVYSATPVALRELAAAMNAWE